MERHYRFAGVEITVSMPEERFYSDDLRLAPFAVAAVTDPHVYRFEAVDAFPAPEGDCVASLPGFRIYTNGEERVRYIGTVEQSLEGAFVRASHRGKEHRVQVRSDVFPGRIGVKSVLSALEAEHLIARAGGFVFHCSYIDWQGRAILFTAPSQTGKSTQAALWNRFRGAPIINGDRAAVRIVDGQAVADGIPFAGSSEYCQNRTLPVAAVVYLGQAEATSIRRMRGYEAFARVWEGCSVNTWDRADMTLVSAAVEKLVGTVPVFHLPCTPDESAVIALENAMKKQVSL